MQFSHRLRTVEVGGSGGRHDLAKALSILSIGLQLVVPMAFTANANLLSEKNRTDLGCFFFRARGN